MNQKKFKARNTRNSQRLVNLEQQEKLYRELGVSAMANKKDSPVEEIVEEQDEGSEHDEENSDPKESPPKNKGSNNQNKKLGTKKAKAKRAHSISSDSDSEREKSVPKKKKKRKSSLLGKKGGLSNSPASQFTVNADVHAAADGTRQQTAGLQGNGSPLVFPQNLMVSPNDSGFLTAHMNAYAKFLVENNMLIGQGQNPAPQTQGFPAPDNMPASFDNRASNLFKAKNQDANIPLGGNQNRQLPHMINTSSNVQRGIMDDSSLDGLSNADPGEVQQAPRWARMFQRKSCLWLKTFWVVQGRLRK